MGYTNMNIRIDEDIKERASTIFEAIGINMTSAINTFLKRVVLENGLPYSLSLNNLNNETVEAILEGERIAYDKNAKTYNTFMDLVREIENE